ncbi:UNVERIFIED_CONTAM: hypothetical protein NCL1_20379 [Trichonephila clavipes]
MPLVKIGSDLSQPDSPVCYQSVKRNIIARFKDDLPENIQGSVWGSSLMGSPIPFDLLKTVGVANFRIITGHNYLTKLVQIRLRRFPS